jgi:hypothetical protein
MYVNALIVAHRFCLNVPFLVEAFSILTTLLLFSTFYLEGLPGFIYSIYCVGAHNTGG